MAEPIINSVKPAQEAIPAPVTTAAPNAQQLLDLLASLTLRHFRRHKNHKGRNKVEEIMDNLGELIPKLDLVEELYRTRKAKESNPLHFTRYEESETENR